MGDGWDATRGCLGQVLAIVGYMLAPLSPFIIVGGGYYLVDKHILKTEQAKKTGKRTHAYCENLITPEQSETLLPQDKKNIEKCSELLDSWKDYKNSLENVDTEVTPDDIKDLKDKNSEVSVKARKYTEISRQIYKRIEETHGKRAIRKTTKGFQMRVKIRAGRHRR